MPDPTTHDGGAEKLPIVARTCNRARIDEEVSYEIGKMLRARGAQGRLARRLGVKPCRVAQIKMGGNLTIYSIADIALALGKSVHVVFSDGNPMEMKLSD
jgi:uncharacterized protein (DUF697 family)